jgi:tRNA dimethylallyltransferase
MSNKQLLYIAGPTAVGKTAVSVTLAQSLNTEIISCDARQCYREMTLGTAVPTVAERQGIPHHFIQNKSIHQAFDAGAFEKEGLLLLERLFKTYDRVVMVGGSGLYAQALMEGLDEFPQIDPEAARQVKALYRAQGLDGLQKALKEKDPQYYRRVDLHNPRRLIRALEVCQTAQKPYSDFLGQSPKKRPFATRTLRLSLPRELLYHRINQRVDQMVRAGLEAEARGLYAHKNLPALQTVGYQEWFAHFDGSSTRQEAIAAIQKNTRRYAKRQLTWLGARPTPEIDMQKPENALKKALEILENIL